MMLHKQLRCGILAATCMHAVASFSSDARPSLTCRYLMSSMETYREMGMRVEYKVRVVNSISSAMMNLHKPAGWHIFSGQNFRVHPWCLQA